MPLLSLDDDILIHIVSFLLPLDIIQIRKTNKKFYSLSHLRIIWTNVCNNHIIGNGYPFPDQPSLDQMCDAQLEQHTLHASSLASRWRSGSIHAPRRDLFIDATSSTSVFQVQFVPGHTGDWILTASKSVWDILTLWAITFKEGEEDANNGTFEKLCDWSPRGGIFNGSCLNTDISSNITLAVSVLKDDEYTIEVLAIVQDASGTGFQTAQPPVASNLKPVKLQGDLLVISDNVQRTEIIDLKTGEKAVLEDLSDQDEEDVPWKKQNRCIDVTITRDCILVVRARSISLYNRPLLTQTTPTIHTPIARHSFGWIDGVSVAVESKTGDISILLRAESDDPWASGSHTLDLYKLFRTAPLDIDDALTHSGPFYGNEGSPPPPFLPYSFPPILQNQVPAIRGALRCKTVVLGSSGTAVWIQPKDRTFVGLVDSYPIFLTDDPNQVVLRSSMPSHIQHCEAIAIATFPGPLMVTEEGSAGGRFYNTPQSGRTPTIRARSIYTNQFNNWTALDYDEVMGRIVVASSFGNVTVLEV